VSRDTATTSAGLAAVEIEDLRYTYPDGTAALRGVSLRLERGERLGLLGPNGAGKSTLLLHLNGLLGGEGEIRIAGERVEPGTLRSIRRRVGLVFQNPDDQLFMPRVFDDVAFGPLNAGHDGEEVRRRVARALAQVGMSGAEQRPPHHLSLGQKKRVAIATVLVLDCEVLVLDEPAAGLDPRGRRGMINLLRELPLTQIIATHDLDFALELCTRAAVLDEGRLIAEGDPAELLRDHALLEAHGLEVPPSLRPT